MSTWGLGNGIFDYILTSIDETIVALTFKENPKAILTSQADTFLCDFDGKTTGFPLKGFSLHSLLFISNYYNLCISHSGGVIYISMFFILCAQ